MRKKKKVVEWTHFELITKVGLEALGYSVSRDMLIAGSQIDLYAESIHHLHVHRLIVECKDYIEEVGVEIVRRFTALVDAISTKSHPVGGLIVSKSGFTKTARAFAERVNILLLELDDLLKLTFDPYSIIPHVLEIFDGDDLRQVYVDLSCTHREGGVGSVYKPVEMFLDSFLSTTKRSGVALLGNFGSGKTSLCKHYAYILANRFLKNNSSMLPIYINLRDLNNLLDLKRDMLKLLQTLYGAKVTPQGWDYWLLNKPTLFFLDGFDEMASRMDKIEIARNVSQLAVFTANTRTKILITCRTHFFKSEIEEQALGSLLRLYLRDWGAEELKEYVSKSLPFQVEPSLKVIHSTYNLEELSRTPIFLNMITATIGDVKGVVNQAKLYQVYTDGWIQIQDYRSKLSPFDKEMFMQELAFEMFITGQARIHHGGLPAKIKILFLVQDYEALNALDRDIRTCSFLIRDSEGLYYFIHKSFMEFFVAFKLAKEVKANKLEDFAKRNLTIEVAGFLLTISKQSRVY
jgi:Restriction endonuclease/NACHT domain